MVVVRVHTVVDTCGSRGSTVQKIQGPSGRRIVREHRPVHSTYNEKVESQQGRSDTKPTKLVVGHCYPGIPAELVVADGRTNDVVFESTDGCWPEKRKN